MSAPCKSCSTTGGSKGGARTRGLCASCYARLHRSGDLAGFPPVRRRGEDVLDDLRAVGFDPDRPALTQFRDLAPRMGLTVAALSQAYYRARRTQNVPASASRPGAASSPGAGSSSPTVEAGTPSKRSR